MARHDEPFSYVLPGFGPLTDLEKYQRLDAMIERRDEIRRRRRERIRQVTAWFRPSTHPRHP